MTSCSWLRIDSFIYLQITSSDCSSEAGKAITSAERKAGNKNYSFRHLFFTFSAWVDDSNSIIVISRKRCLTQCISSLEKGVGVVDSWRRGKVV